jgi:hypothetical protein
VHWWRRHSSQYQSLSSGRGRRRMWRRLNERGSKRRAGRPARLQRLVRRPNPGFRSLRVTRRWRQRRLFGRAERPRPLRQDLARLRRGAEMTRPAPRTDRQTQASRRMKMCWPGWMARSLMSERATLSPGRLVRGKSDSIVGRSEPPASRSPDRLVESLGPNYAWHLMDPLARRSASCRFPDGRRIEQPPATALSRL